MLRYKNVLVGLQFEFAQGDAEASLSADAQEAMQKAMHLARSEGSRLCFVTSFETGRFSKAEAEAAAADEDTVVPALHRALDALVAQAATEDIEANWEFLFGTAWKELCAKISADSHDLLIVGARRLSSLGNALLGRTSRRVLMHAACPVWVARHKGNRDYERILIATDLGEMSREVLRHGLALANWNDSEVFILHTVPNWYEGRWYRAGHAKDTIVAEHENERTQARATLDDHITEVTDSLGVEITAHIRVESAEPERAILSTATHEDIDLVVMGMVGRSGMQKYLIGDTATKLVAELPCSLLAIRPE